METAKSKTREEAIIHLSERIDTYEKYTTPHSRLMAELSVRLARRFGLAELDVQSIAEAALLHDIGLYALTPKYHSDPGPLSFEERIDLWRHPIVGEQQMAKRDESRHAQLLVRWHHEWWNGSGYPDMLAFEDIPIGARILRAVELYNALISDRPYRPRLSEPEAVTVLQASAGIECDPYVVKALVELIEEMREPEIVQAAPPLEESGSEGQLMSPGPAASEDQVPQARPEPGIGLATPAPYAPANPSQSAPPGPRPKGELLSRAAAEPADKARQWRNWKPSQYRNRLLLGFEASVLRQINFRSVAIPLSESARLDWYMKSWGKVILSNDPRAWAAAVARAAVEADALLGEEHLARILEDVYVPGARLNNSDLRRWFGETDAWWMDNLRRNIDRLEEETLRAQALALGIQTGDYALSFDEETRDLKRPLTTVFWRLAGRALPGIAGHRGNRVHNLPVEEFVRRTQADMLYLALPSGNPDPDGANVRSQWRESWVRSLDPVVEDTWLEIVGTPQSKQSYLSAIDRLLRSAAHFKTWAVRHQDFGPAMAREITELIKEHRPIQTTYTKDVTEVSGGLRNYIIVAQHP